MTTQVCITVDVEFDAGGVFEDPRRNRPIGPESVLCNVDGDSSGLDFILDTLDEFGFKGVFFVEALNTCYFGDAPMGWIANKIHARGHDVQLHLHPCWTVFLNPGWENGLESGPPNDSLAACSEAELERSLGIGLEAFKKWNLPAPIAVRAGNLQAGRSLYPVMKRYGISLASNLGIGIYLPLEADLHLNGGRHWIDGVLEIPVTSYKEVEIGSYLHRKCFTVIGTGTREAKGLLFSAAAAGSSPVVVLTHSFEYVRKSTGNYDGLKSNELTRSRFRSLCRFLADRRDQFEVTTFSQAHTGWVSHPGTDNPSFNASFLDTALRLLENRIK